MKTANKKHPMRTFVMGDIHGAYKALLQCLERVSFDKDKDSLIQLGDVADGFEQVYDCVEELLKIRNLVAMKGNHDEWLNQFYRAGPRRSANYNGYWVQRILAIRSS
jgi:serine/threonine protein phosphatase 1